MYLFIRQEISIIKNENYCILVFRCFNCPRTVPEHSLRCKMHKFLSVYVSSRRWYKGDENTTDDYRVTTQSISEILYSSISDYIVSKVQCDQCLCVEKR
jgi:hypothetical protein